jgi:hypothetical protein
VIVFPLISHLVPVPEGRVRTAELTPHTPPRMLPPPRCRCGVQDRPLRPDVPPHPPAALLTIRTHDTPSEYVGESPSVQDLHWVAVPQAMRARRVNRRSSNIWPTTPSCRRRCRRRRRRAGTCPASPASSVSVSQLIEAPCSRFAIDRQRCGHPQRLNQAATGVNPSQSQSEFACCGAPGGGA